MKKYIAAGTAAAVLTTGCEVSPGKIFGSEVTSKETEATVIALGASAVNLPDAVRYEVQTVVRMKTRDLVGRTSMASGVRIPGGFVTSGHVFRDEDNNLKSPCFTMNALASRPDWRLAMWSINRAASLRREGEKKWADLAYLESPIQQGKPTAHVSATPRDLPAGEEVFFVNYQPVTEKQQRGPEQPGLNKYPAIYSGYILKDPKGNKNQITLLTGAGRSYGAIKDTEVRRGASGGALFTRKGRLFATTTAIDVRIGDLATVADKRQAIEKRFNVGLQGKARRLQVVYAQPVDGKLLDSFASDVKPFQSCPAPTP